MGRKASTINLSGDERYISKLRCARTIQAQTVIRARILLFPKQKVFQLTILQTSRNESQKRHALYQ